MTPSRWQQIEALYNAARERGISALNGVPEDLRREVESLLAQESTATNIPNKELHPSANDEGQATIAAGRMMGPYRIESSIGQGGMGQVFRATDTRLNRPVAIKTSLTPFDPRFHREARAIATLNHPNICTLYDIGPNYLVMELCEGETLAVRLKRGGLVLSDVLATARQITDALVEAHAKGIVHRDLKPSNVILTRTGAKVLDFGLAKIAHDETLTASQAIMGTPAYMAPEQAAGHEADTRADLFSLGLIFYEMVAGRLPVPGASLGRILATTPNAGVEPVSRANSRTPARLDSIIRRLLKSDPAERIQSASEVLSALEQLAQPRRSPYPWIAAAALVVLAVGTGLTLRRPSTPGELKLTQITAFSDSAVEPSLSWDGRMLAFVRGPNSGLAGAGQIGVKLLPSGEPVMLTTDSTRKMDPVFSPDGTRIAYAVSPNNTEWNTWQVPVLGGKASVWLPNAEGLKWTSDHTLLFSEIQAGIHMALVTSTDARTEPRHVYMPVDTRGMAHRSALSPDGKFVLVVEMDQYGWLPCRLVPFEGSTAGKRAGPAGGACTNVAWSPDGRWMYFTSDTSGSMQLWRQAFPDGESERLTSGPFELEGLAVAPDGRWLASSVGSSTSTIWLAENGREREISGDGIALFPAFGDGFPSSVFSSDGKKLWYLKKNGPQISFGGGELRSVDLTTGTSEPFIPGLRVTSYDLSPDGKQIVFAAITEDRHSRIWLAPVNRRTSPQLLNTPDALGPVFGANNNVYFRGQEGQQYFLFELDLGTGAIRKFTTDPAINAPNISPDRKWIVSTTPVTSDEDTVAVKAYPTSGGAPTILCSVCFVHWPGDMKYILISFGSPNQQTPGTTYLLPLPVGRAIPTLPPAGFQSEEELTRIPGVRKLDGTGLFPGPTAAVYASVHYQVQRNIYRVDLP